MKATKLLFRSTTLAVTLSAGFLLTSPLLLGSPGELSCKEEGGGCSPLTSCKDEGNAFCSDQYSTPGCELKWLAGA